MRPFICTYFSANGRVPSFCAIVPPRIPAIPVRANQIPLRHDRRDLVSWSDHASPGAIALSQTTETGPSALLGMSLAAGVVCIWSGFIIATRAGGLSPLTAWDLAALRFTVSGLILIPVWFSRPRDLRPSLMQSVVLSIFGGLGYALITYWGFKSAPATHAAILLPGLMPFLVAALAWAWLDERPSRARWIGLGFTALGIASLSVETFGAGSVSVWGDAAIVTGSLMWSAYTVLLRLWRIDPWAGAGAVTLVSAVVYLPLYAMGLPSGMATASWGDIVLQAVYQGLMAAIIAMVLYIRGVAVLGAGRMGMAMALIPAISGMAAVPILGETLSPWVAVGLALVSLGALASHTPGRVPWIPKPNAVGD